MDPFDFVIIGAGPAGEAAAYKARELGASVAVIDRRWFGGSCPHIGCLPSKSLLDGAARHHANPAAYDWPAASAARDYMVNRPPGAAEPDDSGHVERLTEAGAVVYRGNATITGRGTRRGPARRHRRTTCRRGTSSSPSARVSKVPPIDGHRRGPDLDQPRGDPRPRAAAQPARPRRRPDRLRAGPGLRPVRRPDDDRPVRTAARADRPPAQLRGHPRGARARRRHRPDRRPGAPGAGGRRARRRARDRPRRRLDGGGARHPPRGRARRSRSRTSGSSTTASTRAAGRRSRATAGCASPTACGSSATRPAPSCTPTRPTTRASSPSGWRSARPSSPTTAPCRARRTRTRRRRRSGVTARGGARGRASTRSSSSPTSRRAPRATRSRPTIGHVTIVVDRATRELVGAAMACPDASAAIHECVLAIKARVTGRRPGRDDPRLPVDVAHLQRAVRRRAARARRRRDRPTQTP